VHVHFLDPALFLLVSLHKPRMAWRFILASWSGITIDQSCTKDLIHFHHGVCWALLMELVFWFLKFSPEMVFTFEMKGEQSCKITAVAFFSLSSKGLESGL
jgi:hypothetical protein